MENIHIVTIEKLIFGGQALAKLNDGQVVFIWGALPGEKVEIELLKKKKKGNYFEAKILKIIEASDKRQDPISDHYLSCSPWQIMTIEEEEAWKKNIAKEVYEKFTSYNIPADIILIKSDKEYGYRNKIEYSFSEKDDQTVSFAFFERGKNNRIAISPCKLANETINNTASTLLEWINDMAIPHRSLKSLVIRSNEKGDTIAALFIKDKLAFDEYPEIKESLQGFKIYYSTHKSPASRPDALLYEAGQEYLKEPIKDTPLTYGLLSFFQVNTPVFTKTIENIEKELTPETHLLDFYSGVGSIGLPLHTKYKTCTLIDSSKQAIEYAMKNIESNNIKNCEAHCVEAEKITEIITENHVLIIDPPRAGLHKDVIAKILDTPPKKIIYLSCNLTTQARDIEHLHELYTLKSITLYNYFPRTPHIEGLCILERKK